MQQCGTTTWIAVFLSALLLKILQQQSHFAAYLLLEKKKRGGLILCKSHYAEFAGPGAAIACPTTPGYSFIVVIGNLDLDEVISPSDRQRAYSRRIQWIRWLQKIVFHPDPVQRAEKLFLGFEEFFSGRVVSKIPDEILALLAGVLPQTISAMRSHNHHFGLSDDFSHANDEAVMPVVILDGNTFQPSKFYTSHHEQVSHLPLFSNVCAPFASSLSPLNPPILGDFDSNSYQGWGVRRSKNAVGLTPELSTLPQSA